MPNETLQPAARPRVRIRLAAVALCWLAICFADELAGLAGHDAGSALRIIEGWATLFAAACLVCSRTPTSPWRRLLLLPGVWLAHIVLTAPAAAALGILMKLPDRERTLPEQKAIFLLAAIPIGLWLMSRSRLFTRFHDLEAPR